MARYENGPYLSIQVKSLRKRGYVFMQKDRFEICPDWYLALAILNQSEEPRIYLIPSEAWKTPNALLVDRDYVGKKSNPEWGLNISNRNMGILERFSFQNMIPRLQELEA